MNPCDNPEMDTREVRFAIGVSILLLALAVFGWGLHSKLSLYHARARASETLPIAKLLSERERPTDIAQQCDLNYGDLHAVALAATVILMPRPAKTAPQAAPRHDAPPLPSRTLALKGPSLRRPPPSHIA
jgi:hypothetical protein